MKQRQSEHRIIEQVIVFGAPDIEKYRYTEIQKNPVKVQVLYCYPQSINGIQYEMWAYPDGIKIYDQSLKIINDQQPQFSLPSLKNENVKSPPDSIHSFVLTDYLLNRTYCSCLTFHEKKCIIDDRIQSYQFRTHPKMMRSLLQYSPRFSGFKFPQSTFKQFSNTMQRKTLVVYVPKTLIVCSRIPVFQYQRQFLQYIHTNLLKQNDGQIKNLELDISQIEIFQQLIHRFGYPVAENKFDYLHKQPKVQKKPIVYRTRLRKMPTIIQSRIEKLKIDTQIFKQLIISSLLLPKFGQSPTQVTEKGQCISYLPTMNKQCFSPPGVNILHCFQVFGINNMITLWKNILLQRQILVFCSDPYQIIQLFETLNYLIQPIKWQSIYIPFLPFHLHNHIDAIGGYMIGMSRIHMDYIIQHFNLKNKCLVNVDEMIVLEETANDEVPLPIQIVKLFNSKLSSLIGKQQNDLFGSLLSNKTIKSAVSIDRRNPINIRLSLEIKSVFFDCLLLLFNNYLNFVKWDEKDGIKIQVEEYIQFLQVQGKVSLNHLQQNQMNVKDSKHSQSLPQNNWPKFIQAMTRTMVFIRLAEFHWKTYKVLGWNQYTINELFVYCYNIIDSQMKKKSSKEPKMWVFPQNAFHQNYMNFITANTLKKVGKPNIYQLEHYAVKYLKYMEFKQPWKLKVKQSKKKQQTLFSKILSCASPFVDEQDQNQNQKNNMNKYQNLKLSKQLIDLQNVFGFLQISDSIVQIVRENNQNSKFVSVGFDQPKQWDQGQKASFSALKINQDQKSQNRQIEKGKNISI